MRLKLAKRYIGGKVKVSMIDAKAFERDNNKLREKGGEIQGNGFGKTKPSLNWNRQ